MEKLQMKTNDALEGNMAETAALFPLCIAECKDNRDYNENAQIEQILKIYA